MNDKLKVLLKYAVNNIPAYNQEKYKSLDIETFPVVTKAEIRFNYSQYLSNEYLNDKDRILNILEGKYEKINGSYNEIYEFDNYIFEETTGTSGVPFRIVKTKSERIRSSLSIWKQRKYYDDLVDTQNLFCLNHLSLHERDKGTYNFTEKNIVKLYKEIEESGARWIHVSPNPLYEHIKILQKEKHNFNFSKVKYIECTGNYYSNEQEQLFRNFFDAEVVNQYGSIETWGIAMSCKNKDLHVLQDNVYLEILDEDNKIIEDYDKIGYVTVTTLNQRLMPLIRYQNGDLAMWKKNFCDCGICSPILVLAPGRKTHLIKGIDDRIFGNIFFMKVIQRAVRDCNEMNILDYVQVIQTKENEFTIYINKLENINEFLDSIKKLTEQFLKKSFRFKAVILSDDVIAARRGEKVNLFLSKC